MHEEQKPLLWDGGQVRDALSAVAFQPTNQPGFGNKDVEKP
jgi:hypothetical protein